MTNKCWLVKSIRDDIVVRIKRFYITEDPGSRETARRNALEWAKQESCRPQVELATIELEERRTQ